MTSYSANRRDVLKGAAGMVTAGALTLSAGARAAGAADRPNIIHIVADDLGFADLSCYGRRDYATPNIDRLATEGMLFSQAYANSAVCSATRVGLITGRYQYRLVCGLDEPLGFDEDEGLPPELPTMPRQLAKAGYHTILIGKWHMGGPPKFGPLASGYDRFFGIYGGGTDYFNHEKEIPGAPFAQTRLIDQDRAAEREGYVTEIFGDEALKAIETAPRGKPFFMSLHFTAPHSPWQGPGDRGKPGQATGGFNFDGGSLAIYAEMVRGMDVQVGRLLEFLERRGLADNTMVLFTSDNGGERFSDMWPLVGAKTELLEGGIRVPLLVRWPARIAPGSRTLQTAMSMDMLPTFMAAAGAAPDPGFPTDGMNLLPVLLGGDAVSRDLFWRYKALDQVAHRSGDWKYLQISGREYLFNLAEDVRERANLAQREPARFRALKEAFVRWNADMLPYTVLTDSYANRTNGAWVDR